VAGKKERISVQLMQKLCAIHRFEIPHIAESLEANLIFSANLPSTLLPALKSWLYALRQAYSRDQTLWRPSPGVGL
jgi:hypothetical protein